MSKRWTCRRCGGTRLMRGSHRMPCIWCDSHGEVDLRTAAMQEQNMSIDNAIDTDEATQECVRLQKRASLVVILLLACALMGVFSLYLAGGPK